MFNGQKVIDIHGHMSTPPHFRAFAYQLIALRSPQESNIDLPEEALERATQTHIKYIEDRQIDLQLLSPRPVAMMHWESPFLVEKWTRTTNDTIAHICKAHPDRFVGIAQLPQNSQIDSSNCLDELEYSVNELGFVGAILNPDPGGDRNTPGMNKDYWFPLYEKAQELDVPLIVHPSITLDRRVEIIPHNYQYNNVTEEYLATQLLEHSHVFETFPRLKVVVCHCGGALDRFVIGTARNEGRDLSNNLFFDTCAYNEEFLTAAIKQKGVERMVFGTEAPGSGRSMRPGTDRSEDDLVPVIGGFDWLTMEEKIRIFHDNPLKVFTRLEV